MILHPFIHPGGIIVKKEASHVHTEVVIALSSFLLCAVITYGGTRSGKSYLAKLLRDIEVEREAPPIHSMDVYFMTKVEKAEESELSKSSGSLRGKTQVMKKEEDLFTITSGLLFKRDGDDKCLAMVNVIEETISRLLNACKSPSYKKREIKVGVQHFYYVLSYLRRPQGRDLDLARKHIASYLVELQSILKTEEFLNSNKRFRTCEAVAEDSTTASGFNQSGLIQL
ncbi:N-alpha-acetyltransferase 35, NatC auxiliary subunit [Tanacetum coccineum]